MRSWRGRVTIAAGVLAAAWASAASAQVTIERGASVLVFPKIIANTARDTLVQLTNTSNSIVRAHCFYVNAALTDPTRPPGPLNPPLWLEVDFDLLLTKQQPTQWRVSSGRDVNPADGTCSDDGRDCIESGLDPGRIPPVVPDFVGELKCVQVDDSGAPVSGNSLLGVATLFTNPPLAPPEPEEVVVRGASKYNAVGIRGDENNGDPILVLGGGQCAGSGTVCTSDEDCGDQGPCAREYDACPQTWILNHLAEGAPDLILNDTIDTERPSSFVETELTIVPCTQNYETQVPSTVTLQFQTWNEFESQFSTSTSVSCWGNFRLGDIGAPALTFPGQLIADPQGTMVLQTRMRPSSASAHGVIMVSEEFHAARPSEGIEEPVIEATTVAGNLHFEGERPVPDVITIPFDQVQP